MLDLAYDDATTFVDVLRDVVETHFLGGNLPRFLDVHTDGRQDLCVLLYSHNEATVVRPYWLQYWSPNNVLGDEDMANEAVRPFLLQLSFDERSKDGGFVDPSEYVEPFVRIHFGGAIGCDRKRKFNYLGSSGQNDCIEMKLAVMSCLARDWQRIAGYRRMAGRVNVLLR